MSLDKATVAHVARLARLKIDDADLDKMAGELGNILTWIEQLGEIDTEGVAPMTSVVETVLRRRPDEVTDGGRADDIVSNAPERAGHFFVVPKVVE